MDDGGGLERRERENDGDIIGEAKLVQNRQLREMEGGEGKKIFSAVSNRHGGFLVREEESQKKRKVSEMEVWEPERRGRGSVFMVPGMRLPSFYRVCEKEDGGICARGKVGDICSSDKKREREKRARRASGLLLHTSSFCFLRGNFLFPVSSRLEEKELARQ